MIPKWKVKKLLQSHFYILPACDTLVAKQSQVIDRLNLTLRASIKLDSIHVLQRDNKIAEAETLRKQAINTKAIHDQEIKQIKRQKLNMTLIAVGEAILLIVIIL